MTGARDDAGRGGVPAPLPAPASRAVPSTRPAADLPLVPAAVLPEVATDGPAAVLLVHLDSDRVVHANAVARQLAPGLALPVAVDAWADAAGLRDPQGCPLSGTEQPLSRAAHGQAVPGRRVSARRSSAATSAREPLYAVGLPLEGAPGLEGHSLVMLMPVRGDDEAASHAQAEQLVRDRAVLATGCAFTVASATALDAPLTWVNPAFCATTGFAVEEVVGRNCRFLQGPGTDREAVAALGRALAEGRDHLAVLLNYRRDGTAFWNQVAVSPVLDASGAVTHYVGVQTDVTARVEADRSRERALQSERRARADAERARADAEQARERAEQARERAEQARERAERLSRRMSLLAEATGVLAATLSVEEALDRLARLVVPTLADWAMINLADEHGRAGTRTFVRHRDGREDVLESYRRLVPSAVSPDSPLHRLQAGGPPVLAPSFALPTDEELTLPEREIRRLSAELGTRSLVHVPLTARHRVVGTMMLVHGVSDRTFGAEDLELAVDLGRRAGLAVDNARLYTREHGAAVALQRSLLPALPDVPGLALAADYLPAGADSQVGGDWWDVFTLPDGAVGLAVGDVMGHDLAAAAAMGQLRSVLRTCAWAGDDPATALDRMDRLVQGFDMAQLATCFYARLEPGRAGRPARLTWSNAGHLPPVLLGPDGGAGLLVGGSGVPIGVPTGEPRVNADAAVPVGSTLLLYTDGLVEVRGSDIDTDVQALRARVARHRPADGPRALVDALVDGLPELGDDVALLAARVL